MGLLTIIFIGIAFSNKLCSDSVCNSCTSGFNLLSTSCLIYCPTGYSISGNSCKPNQNLDLFVLNFLLARNYSAKSIGNFIHPQLLTFNGLNGEAPMATFDRGFYFTDKTQLVSDTSWVVSPNFCFSITFKAFADGTIFQIKDGNKNYLQIVYQNGVTKIIYYNIDNNGEYQSFI